MRTPRISDAELDRLDELLSDTAFDEAMRLDEVQGYLCAATTGPVPIPEADRLVEILGSEDAAATPAGQEAALLIRKLTEELVEEIGHDDEPLMLYLYPDSDEDNAPSDYEPWCLAYLHGIDTAVEDWFDAVTDEEEVEWLDERLFPLMVLTGEAEAAAKQHGESWPEGDARAEMKAEAEDSLARVVTEIYRFWAAKHGAGTMRRDVPKIGRNDPCPCGSGKKFKQCCGTQ